MKRKNKEIDSIINNNFLNIEDKKRRIREIEEKRPEGAGLIVMNRASKLVKADIVLLDNGTWRVSITEKRKKKR